MTRWLHARRTNIPIKHWTWNCGRSKPCIMLGTRECPGCISEFQSASLYLVLMVILLRSWIHLRYAKLKNASSELPLGTYWTPRKSSVLKCNHGFILDSYAHSETISSVATFWLSGWYIGWFICFCHKSTVLCNILFALFLNHIILRKPVPNLSNA